MSASTRRAALGAILAAPLASMPAVAASFALSSDEVRFLALGPQIVPMLDEYDRVWEKQAPFYEAWSKAAGDLTKSTEECEQLPEWFAYVEARRPADEIDNTLDEMLEPFEGIRFVSVEAIMLRHRIALTYEYRQDDVEADVLGYWAARSSV